MRPNRLRELWAEGRVALNAWLALGTPYGAEILAHLPYDSITIDMQHGMFDFETALAMFQAISTSAAVPMARIPANEGWMAQKILDAGAYGVICPMISTAEECRRFVAACRYPLAGERSFGPARGLLFGGSDYLIHANDCILTWAMIETAQGVDHVEEILAVPGLDGIYVGPNDLALNLGHPLMPDVHAELREVIGQLLRTAKGAGKRAGIFCSTPEFGREMAEWGFDLVTVSNDAEMLRRAAAAMIEAQRGSASAGTTTETGWSQAAGSH